MATFPPPPAKTDSLADYKCIFRKSSNSTKFATDSEYDFGFGNSTKDSDGKTAISTSSSNNNCSRQEKDSYFENILSFNGQFSINEAMIVAKNVITKYVPDGLQSQIPLGPSIPPTFDGTVGTMFATGNPETEDPDDSTTTKFFTPLRIAWWLGSVFIYFIFSRFLAVLFFFLQFVGCQNAQKVSTKHTIKWSVEDFSEEIKVGLLTSPPFVDPSGDWRIVIVQKECIDGLQTTFGLILTDLPREIDHVKAIIEFTCFDKLGNQHSPGFQSLYCHHSFACIGDCAYTRPIILCQRQLADNKDLHIKCRIEFERQERGYLNAFYQRFKTGAYDRKPSSKRDTYTTRNSNQQNSVSPTFGNISIQKHIDPRNSKDKTLCCSPTVKFIQHPETKTFVWEIPNFRSLLKNAECWGLFSPQFFVNSHDFCSIWRLKFFELLGVFRLHVQLRGLPGAIKQVKTWHLVTLLDNCGDLIVPENSNPRLKYPDYMTLWGSHRHILYRRENILDRFTSKEDTVTVRISLQVEPNELAWMEDSASDAWMLA